jgi:hypothetical protein
MRRPDWNLDVRLANSGTLELHVLPALPRCVSDNRRRSHGTSLRGQDDASADRFRVRLSNLAQSWLARRGVAGQFVCGSFRGHDVSGGLVSAKPPNVASRFDSSLNAVFIAVAWMERYLVSCGLNRMFLENPFEFLPRCLMSAPPSAPPTCVRCRQTLPDGSQYCVACGFFNEDAVIGKTLDTIHKFEQRLMWYRFTAWLGRLFRGF